MRPVGAVLAEQHDEWAVSRRYMGLDALATAQREVIDADHAKEVLQALDAAS